MKEESDEMNYALFKYLRVRHAGKNNLGRLLGQRPDFSRPRYTEEGGKPQNNYINDSEFLMITGKIQEEVETSQVFKTSLI